jgi:hypothetical protein
MFENRINPFENVHMLGHGCSENIYTRQYNFALNQFRSALWKGKVFRLQSKVRKIQSCLYDLNTLKADLRVLGSSYSGIRVVPIHSIIGSEGRTADFDLHFYPLSDTAKDRWINMAMVHLSRIPLPPIQLICIGDAYFVRDGHHRLSVARMFGQVAMDAEVITWNASPPFPWQPDAMTEHPSLVKSPGLST